MPKIDPAIGQPVFYHATHAAHPLAATVAHVNEDGTINIGYLDFDGNAGAACSVELVDSYVDDGEPTKTHFCTPPGATASKGKRK